MNSNSSAGAKNPLEAKLFRAYWNDGLFDLLFGIGAVVVGVLWRLELLPLGAAVPALLALAWNPLRRAVVEPRAGWVEFTGSRTADNRRKLRVAAWIGIGALALLVAVVLRAGIGEKVVPRDLVAGLPAMLVAVMAALVAIGLRLVRFLLYALTFVVASAAVIVAGGEPELAILGGGLTVAVAGAWLLTRFLRGGRPVEER